MKKEEKTIKEWLMMLPIEYRRRAFYNHIIAKYENIELSWKVDCYLVAIKWAFDARKTLEGEEFWDEVSEWNPESKLPPIPTE